MAGVQGLPQAGLFLYGDGECHAVPVEISRGQQQIYRQGQRQPEAAKLGGRRHRG